MDRRILVVCRPGEGHFVPTYFVDLSQKCAQRIAAYRRDAGAVIHLFPDWPKHTRALIGCEPRADEPICLGVENIFQSLAKTCEVYCPHQITICGVVSLKNFHKFRVYCERNDWSMVVSSDAFSLESETGQKV